MTQGGDPSGTGKGGRGIFHPPNHKFEDEIRPELKVNKRGTVSMANSGPNTNGSQFFIAYKAHAHLDGKHKVFGHVIHGFGVLDKMEKVSVEGRRAAETGRETTRDDDSRQSHRLGPAVRARSSACCGDAPPPLSC